MKRKNEINKKDLEQSIWSKWWSDGHSNQWEKIYLIERILNDP